MAPRRWVSKPTPTLRGGRTCCERSATSCSGWMKPKPTGCPPAADAATHRTRRSTCRDRGEDRSASGLLSTIRAKYPGRALEALRIVLLIIGAIYAAPTLLAFRRNHPNRWIILVINVAFG